MSQRSYELRGLGMCQRSPLPDCHSLSLSIYIYIYIIIHNILICYRYIRTTRFHPKFGKNQAGNWEAMSQINEDMCIPTFLERSTIRRKRDSWSLLYSWC